MKLSTFLKKYNAYLELHSHIYMRFSFCKKELHSRWLCCKIHKRLYMKSELLKNWATYFDDIYNVTQSFYEEKISPPQICSKAWFQRLLKNSNTHFEFSAFL